MLCEAELTEDTVQNEVVADSEAVDEAVEELGLEDEDKTATVEFQAVEESKDESSDK